ncbi:hypothetical protein C9374_010971 [Naegleria lovaniensis]|uniref:Cytochrome P450 n=1 Tax=Naegleria lovaniensis TaxID=51637 RepID=A0AA88GHU4_NAELO|nr:uncharacterized protein C9374_010971 [Naegleria lovaniensis]KAG2374401.1 hypothetical protein C9374_010971 [Naegleria lovaniensis]
MWPFNSVLTNSPLTSFSTRRLQILLLLLLLISLVASKLHMDFTFSENRFFTLVFAHEDLKTHPATNHGINSPSIISFQKNVSTAFEFFSSNLSVPKEHVLWILLMTLFVIILTHFIHRIKRVFHHANQLKEIPGTWQFLFSPIRIPFFAPYFYLNSAFQMQKVIEKFGDPETKTFRLSLPDMNIVFVSDKNMLKEMMVSKSNIFEKPKENYELLNVFGESIVTCLNNETWKKHFKVCSPGFSPVNLRFMCKVAVNSCDLLLEQWEKQLQGKKEFMLQPETYSDVTLDILGKAGFDVDLGIFTKNEKGIQFRMAMDTLITRDVALRGFVKGNSEFLYSLFAIVLGTNKAKKICSDILDQVINNRRKQLQENIHLSSDQGHDILSLLIEANLSETLLTDEELKSNAFVLSLAGHETTATLLQWVTYEISKRPHIQERLFHEVQHVLNGRDPTFDDFEKLEYVNMVIMESLRCHPPVTSIAKHVAKKSTSLGKFQIPKGTQIHAFILDSHTRSDNWGESVNEFNPDRFKDAETRERVQHDFTWIPFSGGNRKCTGYKFALMEGCMVLSKLVQRYHFRLINDESVDPVGTQTIVVSRPTNLKVSVSKRE